jgi:hypothetical protein
VARKLSPREAARRIEKWANVGVSIAVIDGMQSGLEVDRREAVARAPKRSGALASTIHVMRISSTVFARTGRLTCGLSAGTRKGGQAPYGRIIQLGGKIPAHEIRPTKATMLAFRSGSELVFAKVVQHPGATFPTGSGYMKINGDRIAQHIDSGLRRGADREIG